MRKMGKMRGLRDRCGGIMVGLLVALCGTQTQAGIISHNGTIDSTPPGTGEVNVLFIGSSLFPNHQEFFEVATHELAFLYNLPFSTKELVSLDIKNSTGVVWTGLQILLNGADFHGIEPDNPIQSPAIDPVQDVDVGPLGPGGISFNDPFAPLFGPVTLAGSSITRFNDQGSGFTDAELTIQFDDPMDPGERISLGFNALHSPGAAGASGFTMSVTPIPEPATVALLGIGLLGLVRRRRGNVG